MAISNCAERDSCRLMHVCDGIEDLSVLRRGPGSARKWERAAAAGSLAGCQHGSPWGLGELVRPVKIGGLRSLPPPFFQLDGQMGHVWVADPVGQGGWTALDKSSLPRAAPPAGTQLPNARVRGAQQGSSGHELNRGPSRNAATMFCFEP
eukprot:363403-Chlamydomonas_euryale.AAC.5